MVTNKGSDVYRSVGGCVWLDDDGQQTVEMRRMVMV